MKGRCYGRQNNLGRHYGYNRTARDWLLPPEVVNMKYPEGSDQYLYRSRQDTQDMVEEDDLSKVSDTHVLSSRGEKESKIHPRRS